MIACGRQYFYPIAAPEHLRGYILDVLLSVSETGPMAAVVLNLGLRHDVTEGSVFRVYCASVVTVDLVASENLELPEEAVGLALVYRSFERLSFALVTNAS